MSIGHIRHFSKCCKSKFKSIQAAGSGIQNQTNYELNIFDCKLLSDSGLFFLGLVTPDFYLETGLFHWVS